MFKKALKYALIPAIPICVLFAISEGKWDFAIPMFVMFYPIFVLIIGFTLFLRKGRAEKQAAEKERKIAQYNAAEERFQSWKDRIEKVEYLGTDDDLTMKTKAKAGSVVGRTVAGGMVGGIAGAVVGGTTAKKETKVTKDKNPLHKFFVAYKAGDTELMRVREDSREFHVLMKFAMSD